MNEQLPSVSHDRARLAVQRLINSHFDKGEYAHISIPANLRDDDDLVLTRYIDQCESEINDLRGGIIAARRLFLTEVSGPTK